MTSSAPVLSSLSEQTLNNTIGAIMLGMIGGTLIFGMSTLQTFWYYKTFPNDSSVHKYSVATLWSLDALHLSMVIHAVYTYAITGFGNQEALLDILWSVKLLTSINVVVILLVHSLYTMRVWRLSGYHNGVLGYLVASVVLAGFVIGIAMVYCINTVKTYPELSRVSWAVNSAMAASTTIDFLISAAMWYYLHKSKGTVKSLNSRISTVIQYSLCSGLITSSVSLCALFTYILLPNTFIFLALEFLLTKLYVASFIAMLNARIDWKDHARGETYLPQSNLNLTWRRSLTPQSPSTAHATSSFWSPAAQNMTLPEEQHKSYGVQIPRPPSTEYEYDTSSKPPTSFYAI
ncbi:hypothetical protein D9613_003607 [Agrocybe pediades]|uniref:DUF6534 domain-containing protein n=1 Tax=Agrocybe pediades TaxID=84607 RepID=A0A8H4QI37_9AGAR|nr:hypothetical protein D9613_003607 [Agrocybe pediades]